VTASRVQRRSGCLVGGLDCWVTGFIRGLAFQIGQSKRPQLPARNSQAALRRGRYFLLMSQYVGPRELRDAFLGVRGLKPSIRATS